MRLLKYSVFSFALILCVAGPALPVDLPAPVKLTLAKAVTIALQNNPAIADADSRQAEAFAAADRAGSDRKIQLRLDSSLTHVSEVQTLETAPDLPGITLGEENSWLAKIEARRVIYSSGRPGEPHRGETGSHTRPGETGNRGG